MANFGNFGGYYGYMPAMQPPVQPPSSTPMVDERIWVANEQAADAYLVAPNNFVRLWDSNKNVFYEKRADATGRLFPVEAYEYKKITANNGFKNESDAIDYKKELDALNGRISALERAVNKDAKPDTDD